MTKHSESSQKGWKPRAGFCQSLNECYVSLPGLKENVIVGRLIPAGTGMEYYRNVRLSPEMEEAAAKVQEEVSQAYEEAERALELMRTEGETEELTTE